MNMGVRQRCTLWAVLGCRGCIRALLVGIWIACFIPGVGVKLTFVKKKNYDYVINRQNLEK